MRMPVVICPRCGWSSEVTARVCGGCGQLLPAAGSSAASSDATIPDVWGGAVYDAEVPLAGTQHAENRAFSRPQAAAGARPSRRHRFGGCLLAAIMTFALLCAVGALAWASAVRPMLHARVDSTIHQQLADAAAQMPALPPGTYSLPVSGLENALLAQLPQPLTAQHFDIVGDPPALKLSFTTYQVPGQVTVQLGVRNGALVATGARVTGPLGLIESGSELQATITSAFAGMAAHDPLTSVSVRNGQLEFVTAGH